MKLEVPNRKARKAEKMLLRKMYKGQSIDPEWAMTDFLAIKGVSLETLRRGWDKFGPKTVKEA